MGKIISPIPKRKTGPEEQGGGFLELAKTRFNHIFAEINTPEFWQRNSQYQLAKIKDGFAIFAELHQDESIQGAIQRIISNRTQSEYIILNDLFPCVRNILLHFPLFNSWKEIRLTKELINWKGRSQSIDKFFRKYENHLPLDFTISTTNAEWHLRIAFPKNYTRDGEVILNDVLPDVIGIKFCFFVMKAVVES